MLIHSFAKLLLHPCWNYVGFLEVGVIHFERTSGVIDYVSEYSYDARVDNNNIRTLQRLSTQANVTMKGPDGAYYKEFQSFVDYYGDSNYGDKWVTAARNKGNTDFTSKYVPMVTMLFALSSKICFLTCAFYCYNRRGNSDFSTLVKRDGQGDTMKRGSAYLNIWMEVVRYLNEAVVKCRGGVLDAASAVDKAVAYYAGSRTAEENSEGILL